MPLRPAPTALAFVLALAAAAPLRAHDMHFTMNVDHDQAILSCDDLEMEFWRDRRGASDHVTVRREKSVELPAAGSAPLRVRAAEHGGVRVQAATGSKASASICLAAGAASESEANAILDQVRVVNEGGELRVTGPDDRDWAAYILLSVPRDAKLDLQATNGELVLHGVSGRFALRTTNGPICVTESAGEVSCDAMNGPITYHGHQGDVRLTAQNGPLSVRLDAATWNGKGLQASTQNGPVQVVAPADLRTGIAVEGSRHSPLQWKGASESVTQDWSRGHALRLGDGPVKVRVSTVNGPVEVKGPRGKPADAGI